MTHDVLRWHSCPDTILRNSGDTVEKHQIRVRAFCQDLAERMHYPLINSDLLKAARHHDEAEKVIGDLPYPAMKKFPGLADEYREAEKLVLKDMGLEWKLTAKEGAMLNLCDRLDAYLWSKVLGCAETDEWKESLFDILQIATKLGSDAWAFAFDKTIGKF